MRKFFSLIAAVLFAGSMMATTVTKTVEELATANSWANGTVVTPFALDEVISVSTEATDANTGKYYTSGQQIRLYQTGAAKMIISAAEGYTISSITVGYVSEKGGIFAEAASGVAVPFENVQSATFTVANSGEATNGQARVTSISVTYDGGAVPPTPADTYTVAGNDAAIFGTSWDVTNTANDMVKAAGIYKWEKAELNLTAGTIIAFKVAKNHSWDVAYPDQNDTVTIAEEGEYTLTIIFDPAIEAVAAKAVKKEPLADPTNCAEAAEAALSVSANNELYNDGKEYTIEGYVTSIAAAYSDSYHNISFWMADTQDGGNVLQAYRAACATEADAPGIGDKVAVTGKLTKFNSTPEFAQGCTFVITEKSPVVPQNLGEKTIAEFLELKNLVDTCILTGTVANVKNTEYGNFDLVELGNAEVSVYVYGLLTAAGESKKCYEEENIAEGDTLKVLAIYSEYNAAPQIKNAIFVEVKHAANPEPQIIELDVEYAEALYIASQEFWQINLFKDYNYETQEVTYPDFYIGVAPKSPTAIAGTYSVEEEIYFIEVDFEDAEINAEEATDFIVTYLGEGMYHYELEFVGEDGNIYILDAILETNAYDHDNDYAVIELTDEVEPQNINNTKAVVKSAKLIKNGQLLIEKDGKTYNAAGQLLK